MESLNLTFSHGSLHFRQVIAVLVLLLVNGIAAAQDPSSSALRWTLGDGSDLKTNQSFTYSGALVTKGNAPIQWEQKTIGSSFEVQSVTGTWTDISRQGQLVFAVQQDGATGTITIQRNSKGLFATMDFPAGDPQGSKVKWKVTEVKAQ